MGGGERISAATTAQFYPHRLLFLRSPSSSSSLHSESLGSLSCALRTLAPQTSSNLTPPKLNAPLKPLRTTSLLESTGSVQGPLLGSSFWVFSTGHLRTSPLNLPPSAACAFQSPPFALFPMFAHSVLGFLSSLASASAPAPSPGLP